MRYLIYADTGDSKIIATQIPELHYLIESEYENWEDAYSAIKYIQRGVRRGDIDFIDPIDALIITRSDEDDIVDYIGNTNYFPID